MTDFALTEPEKYSLVEKREEHLSKWTRELLGHPLLGPLNLTAQQRRVIASLHWDRKVAESNDYRFGHFAQPVPIMGVDERGRIVVQKREREGHPLRQWALSRDGDPVDITGIVRSLKDGRVLRRAA